MSGNPIIRVPGSDVLARSDHPDGSYGLWFECPGCGMSHCVTVGPGEGPRWTWDGNAAAPTFSPSLLVRYTWGPQKEQVVCHSYIRNGRIEFLADCTHARAGQTVDIPGYDTIDD